MVKPGDEDREDCFLFSGAFFISQGGQTAHTGSSGREGFCRMRGDRQPKIFQNESIASGTLDQCCPAVVLCTVCSGRGSRAYGGSSEEGQADVSHENTERVALSSCAARYETRSGGASPRLAAVPGAREGVPARSLFPALVQRGGGKVYTSVPDCDPMIAMAALRRLAAGCNGWRCSPWRDNRRRYCTRLFGHKPS